MLGKYVYLTMFLVLFLQPIYSFDRDETITYGLGTNHQKESLQLNNTIALMRIAADNYDSYIKLLEYIRANFPQEQADEMIDLLMNVIGNATAKNKEICMPEAVFQESITDLVNILQWTYFNFYKFQFNRYTKIIIYKKYLKV